MPEITMISKRYVDEILDDLAANDPDLVTIGEAIYSDDRFTSDATASLGSGRYAIVMHEDLDLWDEAVKRLAATVSGGNEWLVTESISYGPVLVSCVEQMER